MKFMLIICAILALCSCATTKPTPEAFPQGYTGPAIIEGSPWATIVGNGSCNYLYAKVMDKNNRPLAGQTVTATFEYDDPVVYFYDNPVVTDENGVAEFFAVGLNWPGYNVITFSSGEASTSMYVWTRGYGPFQR
ncbi:MAG: hypothetical protein GY800_03330 [Planctomycetes bacterium]|nr:hypothetical protein [Planctomycetota bacterium]